MTLWFAPEDGWPFTAAKLQERPSLRGKWSLAPSWSWSLCHLQTFSTEVPSHRFSWPAHARGVAVTRSFYTLCSWWLRQNIWEEVILLKLYHLPTRSKTLHYMEMEATDLFFGCSHAPKKMAGPRSLPRKGLKSWSLNLFPPHLHVLYLPTLCRLHINPPPGWNRGTGTCARCESIRTCEICICHVNNHRFHSNPCGILMVGNHGRYDKGPNLMRENCGSASPSFGMEGGKWKVEGFHCLPKSTRRINTALKHWIFQASTPWLLN